MDSTPLETEGNFLILAIENMFENENTIFLDYNASSHKAKRVKS